jgi:hypothetical protein
VPHSPHSHTLSPSLTHTTAREACREEGPDGVWPDGVWPDGVWLEMACGSPWRVAR